MSLAQTLIWAISANVDGTGDGTAWDFPGICGDHRKIRNNGGQAIWHCRMPLHARPHQLGFGPAHVLPSKERMMSYHSITRQKGRDSHTNEASFGSDSGWEEVHALEKLPLRSGYLDS